MLTKTVGSIMAKYDLRIKARELRRKGISIKQIAEELGIAKGSASIWVRDIILSVEKREALRESSLKGAERGRLKGSLLQKERWNSQIEVHKKIGIETVGSLNDRELLIAGLALYWGEKGRIVQFCNSDFKVIQFLLVWLRRCFSVEEQDIRCVVSINEVHIQRERLVREY